MRVIKAQVVEVGGNPPRALLELDLTVEQAVALGAHLYAELNACLRDDGELLGGDALQDAARELATKFPATLYSMLHEAERKALAAERSGLELTPEDSGYEAAAELLRRIAALRTTPSVGCESGSAGTHSESTSRCER